MASFNIMLEISSIFPYQILLSFFQLPTGFAHSFFPFVIFSTERMQSKKEIIHSASIHHKYPIVAYDRHA